MKKHRVAITGGIIALVIGVIGFVPFEYHIDCAVRVVPREYQVNEVAFTPENKLSATVFAQVAGRYDQCFVKPGTWVDQGDVIMKLENYDERRRLEQLRGALAEQLSQELVLKQQRSVDEQASDELVEVQERIISLKKQMAQQAHKNSLLEVRAPISGVVLPAQYKAEQAGNGQLPAWSGYLLEPENVGAVLAPDDPICIIATPIDTELERAKNNQGETAIDPIRIQLDAELVVDQADIELIRKGNQVEVCLELMPDLVYDTEIRQISYTNLKQSPANLSSQSGGQLGTVMDGTGRVVPVSTSYYARASIEAKGGMLYQADLRGRAKIYPNQKRSLGWRMYRWLARTFHFAM